MRPLGAVIGVPRQDGRGPVKLLQEHDTNHLMRPGRSPERDPEALLAAQIGRKSVRAANDKNCAGDRLVPPASKTIRKTGTVYILAALVERDKHGFLRDCRRNRRALFRDARGCIARAALRDLMNLDAAKAELAADFIAPLPVAFSELPLGALFQPADGDDDEAHLDNPRAPNIACAPYAYHARQPIRNRLRNSDRL